MRRARFARAVEKVGTAPERASVGEALWFDVRSSDSAGDDSLARFARFRSRPYRNRSRRDPPAHWRCAFVIMHASGPAGHLLSLAVPLLLVLLLDVAAAAALHFRDRFGFKPNAVIRGMCSYMLAIGLLWTMVGVHATGPEHVGSLGPSVSDDRRRRGHGSHCRRKLAAARHRQCRDVLIFGAVVLQRLALCHRGHGSAFERHDRAQRHLGTAGHRGRPPAAQPRCRGAQGAELRRGIRSERARVVLGNQCRRHIVLCVAAACRRLPLPGA